jgi:hypothetical protein
MTTAALRPLTAFGIAGVYKQDADDVLLWLAALDDDADLLRKLLILAFAAGDPPALFIAQYLNTCHLEPDLQ